MPINLNLKANTYIVMWFNSQMELCEKRVTVKRVAREDLGYAVYEDYNRELEASMLEKGMQYPLIVIRNTGQNWVEATVDLKNFMGYTPQAHYLVVYGNQRMRVLDAHEIRDIPVIVAESHDEAIIIHNFFKNQV